MAPPIPIVIDTDIGADPDDAMALAFAAASPEVELLGVTVVDGDVELRARMASRILGMAGRADIPVVPGERLPVGDGRGPTMLGFEGRGLLDLPYGGPEAPIERTPATTWLSEQARRRPFHLVAIGPLTTVAPEHFGPPAEAHRPAPEDLYVDLGMTADQVRQRIEIGCMVTLDRGLALAGACVLSRSSSARLGVFVMIEALRAMGPAEAEIVAVATSQEEVGSRGAVPAAYAIAPDIAIALDLTIANDLPGSPGEPITALGKGPAIKIMDTTQLSHPGLVRQIRAVAERHGIPCQLEVLNRGGTDASLIQRVRRGVAVVTLSIPARYLHTVNEMAHLDDVAQGILLLARVLEALDAETFRTMVSG